MNGHDSPRTGAGEPLVTVHCRDLASRDIDTKRLASRLAAAAQRARPPQLANSVGAGLEGTSSPPAPPAGRPIARIDVLIVGDREMSLYHERFSGVPGTTDVLTFPASGPDEPTEVDIVVCADEARRRASEFGHDLGRELLLYGIHGVLHCLGYDDHDPDSYERMHAEEDRILTDLGLGRVFRPQTADTESGAGVPPQRPTSDRGHGSKGSTQP
ncbi:MAG: rRNA maturation RNase YbeY [Phycisphaerae bacterium]|nr:rRNA maturation RNase YbeY [Phycisphaerae bacterium]